MEGFVLCQREGVENGKNNTLQKKELKWKRRKMRFKQE